MGEILLTQLGANWVQIRVDLGWMDGSFGNLVPCQAVAPLELAVELLKTRPPKESRWSYRQHLMLPSDGIAKVQYSRLCQAVVLCGGIT